MKQGTTLINSAIVLALLFGMAFKCSEGGTASGAPTKAEIKETITKRDRAIRLKSKEMYKIRDMELDFDDSSIKVGKVTDKQIGFGESAKETYPVRLRYTRTTFYTDDREPTVEEVGEGMVEYFYRNGYGEWQARYGSDY